MTSCPNVCLLGGRFHGERLTLRELPARLDVGGCVYERIDDPDTGDFLGGYAHKCEASA